MLNWARVSHFSFPLGDEKYSRKELVGLDRRSSNILHISIIIIITPPLSLLPPHLYIHYYSESVEMREMRIIIRIPNISCSLGGRTDKLSLPPSE